MEKISAFSQDFSEETPFISSRRIFWLHHSYKSHSDRVPFLEMAHKKDRLLYFPERLTCFYPKTKYLCIQYSSYTSLFLQHNFFVSTLALITEYSLGNFANCNEILQKSFTSKKMEIFKITEENFFDIKEERTNIKLNALK